jgi:hypothetical protein
MRAQKLFAVVVTLATLPSYASETNVLLGRQWARCSQQAKILHRLSKDADEAKRLRKVSALLHIHSEAAAGKDISLAEESNTEAEFVHGVSSDDAEIIAMFSKAFRQQAQLDLDACSDSLAKHGSRLNEEVREILRRSKAHSSSAK